MDVVLDVAARRRLERGVIAFWLVLMIGIFGIPWLVSGLLAVGCLGTYLDCYNSWRDTLFVVTLYLQFFIVAFIAVSAIVYFLTRWRHDISPGVTLNRCSPVVTMVGIQLFMLAAGFAPIATACLLNIENDWQSPPYHLAHLLYRLTGVPVILLIIAGIVLLSHTIWARTVTLISLALTTVIVAIIAIRWWWMTGTTPADFQLLPLPLLEAGFLLHVYACLILLVGGIVLFGIPQKRFQ